MQNGEVCKMAKYAYGKYVHVSTYVSYFSCHLEGA